MGVSEKHKNMAKSFDVLFILGPSGVGKSYFAKYLQDCHGWLYVEIDPPEGDGIDVNGLRKEWDEFWQAKRPDDLATELRRRTAGKRKCVLAFSSLLVLSPEHIAAAAKASITIVYLYGPAPLCIKSFLEREQSSGRKLPLSHWLACNQAYLTMSCPGFEAQRVEMFDVRGARRPLEEVLHEIEES